MPRCRSNDWSRLHFLLVEDNEDHQYLMAAVLRPMGVKVAVVERGEDAVELVKSSLATDPGVRSDPHGYSSAHHRRL